MVVCASIWFLLGVPHMSFSMGCERSEVLALKSSPPFIPFVLLSLPTIHNSGITITSYYS